MYGNKKIKKNNLKLIFFYKSLVFATIPVSQLIKKKCEQEASFTTETKKLVRQQSIQIEAKAVKVDSFKDIMTKKYGTWEKYLNKVEANDGIERREELGKNMLNKYE